MMADFRLICALIWLLLTSLTSHSHASESDVNCLLSIKGSLEDPNNYLESWNFVNRTEAFICKFVGIECWNANENKVLNIQLADMGLKGKFPLGVSGCSSLTGLDLSNNNIHGYVPKNISSLIGFITNLDLSSNKFSGQIPVDLANCTYLNVLKLDNNRFTGQIPLQIGRLSRMKTFNVSKNRLHGPLPHFPNANISAESYADNAGLCGDPLPSCVGN